MINKNEDILVEFSAQEEEIKVDLYPNCGGGGGTLKPATTESLGGIIVGNGLNVERNGLLSTNDFYQKPLTGIPKNDLTSDIQISLEKADTALQEHQDISGKVDRSDLSQVSFTGNYSDLVGKPIVPTKTSDLINDNGYYIKPIEGIPSVDFTADVRETLQKAGQVTQDISNIENSIAELATRINSFADSDDTTLDQFSEIVAYIKNNKTLIDGITTKKVSVTDIVDNLTSSAINKPLSAKQGKILKDLIDSIVVPTNISAFINDIGYLTQHQDISGKANIADLSIVATSGNYEDLSNKPIIPTKTSDLINDVGFIITETDPTVPAWAKAATKPIYTASEVGALPSDTIIPTNNNQLINGAGYQTSQDVNAAIAAAIREITGIQYHICTSTEYDSTTFVPTLDGQVGIIYLVPKPVSIIGDATVESATVSENENNIYYEYIYNNRSFELIGDTRVSLDGYLNVDDISIDTDVNDMLIEVFGGE